MLSDIIATDNYGFYNVQLAKIIGLESAVYINELINISAKAYKKNKLDNEQYFTLDRKYITSRTTLTESKQKEIDKSLVNVELIKTKPNENKIKVDYEMYSSLVHSSDITSDKAKKLLNKKTKEEKNKDKVSKIIEALKNKVNTGNEELNQAYYGWIESVVVSGKILSSSALQENEKTVNDYALGNLDTALEVISIATKNGWRDMSYAVTKHQQQSKQSNINNYKPQKRTQLSVDDSISF